MTAILNYQGHVYVDAGEFPCPLPGCEDGLIATHSVNGVPAWWQYGHLFILNENKSVNIPVLNEWAGEIKT